MGWGPRMHVARDSRAGSYLIWAEFRGSPDGCSPCEDVNVSLRWSWGLGCRA